MKIARFTFHGATRLGVVLGDEIADVGAVDPMLATDIGDVLAMGQLRGLENLAARAPRVPLCDVRLEPPSLGHPRFSPSV